MEFKFVLPEELNAQNLKELLENEWLIPRKVRHFLRVRKNVQINGEPGMFHQPVQPGDLITLTFEADDYDVPTINLGNAKAIVPLWEDEHLIIVNKPYGKKTHPNQPDEKDTLLNDLAAYLQPKGQIPYVVHRLDKETSGAILFAKNPIILPILGRMLEKKEIHRVYEALIEGSLPQKELIINKKIGRDRHDRRKRLVDEKRGKTAITHVSTFKKVKNNTWVTCWLETGRTHQIRVHLASIGKPIIGDPLYHPKASSDQRLYLHARELTLTHPFTKETIKAQATPFLSES
ncbi:RluA family pseudouridine synthase [Vagococcus carniphilus]|uniref:Pseudouridine synthase n=1 Tax=Vagococcus carniphilus TaxID=218144 RepID=A0A430ATK5_9ENTE|nr:RluA family pseudouridine synthase [Vagococcus carniphilus]QNN73336.1 RluA family pseudouridine synthase [Vagococcus carniphilus]RSU11385.1 RNA pseudouridine synthase [Vagococcus carniphilus]